MSNSTSSSLGISDTENWILLIVCLGLIGGLIVPVSNAAMVIGIIRDKNLRSRFYMVLGFLLATRALVGFQQCIFFIHRTLRTLNIININLNRAVCYFLQIHTYYVLTLEMVFLLVLIVDRALAITAWKYYYKLTEKQAVYNCAIATVLTVIIKLAPSFWGIDFTENIPCVNSLSPLSHFYVFIQLNVDLILAGFILISYLALIAYVRFWFLPELNNGRNQWNKTAFKQYKKLIPVLTRLVLIHCGFNFTSRVFIASLSIFPQNTSMRIAPYGPVLVMIDYLANIAILLIFDENLRYASFPCFFNSVKTGIQFQPRNTQAARRGLLRVASS